jgi:hypothetical protein
METTIILLALMKLLLFPLAQYSTDDLDEIYLKVVHMLENNKINYMYPLFIENNEHNFCAIKINAMLLSQDEHLMHNR